MESKAAPTTTSPTPSRSDPPLLPVHLALIAVQVMFASLSVAAKLAMKELPPLAVIAFRTPAAALVLLAVRATMKWERVEWGDVPMLAVYAFFGITANQLLFIEGLQRSTATNAVVIGATIPVFTVGVAVMLRNERATLAKLLGLGVAFGGAMTVVGASALETVGVGSSPTIGNLLITLNSLSFSIYLVISRRLLERYRTITVITWVMGLGAIGVLPFGAADLVAYAPRVSTTAWASLVYIVLFPTVGTYFLNTYALKRTPSSLVAIYIYLQPVLGAILAARVLGERPGWSTAGGAALIGTGIWLVNRSTRRVRQHAAAEATRGDLP